jgi:DNA-binding transcriptional regulator YdaS (Cro superfamily)
MTSRCFSGETTSHLRKQWRACRCLADRQQLAAKLGISLTELNQLARSWQLV